MKYIFFILLLISGTCYGQTKYYIRADTTQLEKVGVNNELNLLNSTRSRTGAYLKNTLNGRTGFFYAVDSAYISGTNLVLVRGGGSQNVTVPIGGSTPTWQQTLIAGRTGDSAFIDNGVAGESYSIRTRNIALGFPVVAFKPVTATKNIAFDIMPTGSPGDYSDNGIAWIDVCDTDISSGAGASGAARVGITTTAVQFGSRSFSGATIKPVQLIVQTDARVTLSTTNTATFNIGKITQSQAVSGDYVGYTLLNTNNTVAGSNPIFFIGNDIASNRFGFIRWNNNAAPGTTNSLPNQLEIAANRGATNGIGFATLQAPGSTFAPIDFFQNVGAVTLRHGRLDSLGHWTFGNSGVNYTTYQVHVAGSLSVTAAVRLSGLAASANADDSMMVVNAANGDVGWRAIPTGGGSGDVTKVGTPVNNQVGVWTGDGTIEGDADLTFDGTILGSVGINLASGTTGLQYGGVTKSYDNGSHTRNSPSAGITQWVDGVNNQGLYVYNSSGGGYVNLICAGGVQANLETVGTLTNLILQPTAGVVGIRQSSPTAYLHLGAGTASASTAPLKFTTGTLNTTMEAGAKEYNNAHYETNSALNRYASGGAIKDFIATVDNVGTGETDLFTYTTKASTLAADGEKLNFNIGGTFNDLTATAQLQFYFGGTNVGNTGALTVSAIGGWSANVFVIRTSSTTVRALVTVTTPGASTAVYTTQTDVTGLTLSATNIIKITGTAAGASGGNGDISAKLATITWLGAANN